MPVKFFSKKIFKVMVVSFIAVVLIISNPYGSFNGVRNFLLVVTAGFSVWCMGCMGERT
jgi:hypothetical protein